MYISEKIKDDYKLWQAGDIVFIDSGTGSGKSLFIRKQLSDWAASNFEQILILVNRIELKQQIDDILQRHNNMTIKTATYQSIEHDNSFDYTRFKYIVCDECHYFTEDSPFNLNSNVSLQIIKNLNSHIRILMSATGDTVFNHMAITQNNKVFRYTLKRDFSNILTLSFYNNKKSIESVERFVEHRFPNAVDKIIWFCKSVKQAAALHEQYPNSSFMCSKSQKKYVHLITDNMIINDGEKITFKGKWLFTTNVLDNGFDFKDDNIKLIICDYPDINSVLQCIGRKRKLHSEDNLHIVLANYDNRAISGIVTDIKNTLAQAQAIIDGERELYIKLVGKFGNKSKYIVMDVVQDKGHGFDKKVSTPKYLKVKSDYETYTYMLSEQRDINKLRKLNGEKKQNDGYKQFMKNLLNKKVVYDLDDDYKKDDLDRYLSKLVNIKLFNAEQKELIDKIAAKDNGRLIKAIGALNNKLSKQGLNYIIKSDKDKRRKLEDGSVNKNRLKTYWIVSTL